MLVILLMRFNKLFFQIYSKASVRCWGPGRAHDVPAQRKHGAPALPRSRTSSPAGHVAQRRSDDDGCDVRRWTQVHAEAGRCGRWRRRGVHVQGVQPCGRDILHVWPQSNRWVEPSTPRMCTHIVFILRRELLSQFTPQDEYECHDFKKYPSMTTKIKAHDLLMIMHFTILNQMNSCNDRGSLNTWI